MSFQSMEEYKKLEVYQLAHSLAVEIHAMSLKLPKYELYEEGQAPGLARNARTIFLSGAPFSSAMS